MASIVQFPDSRRSLAASPVGASGGVEHADPEELIAIAEYLVPAGSGAQLGQGEQRAAALAIAEWADGDVDTLRRAWASALRRTRQGDARRTAAALLGCALQLADPLPPHDRTA